MQTESYKESGFMLFYFTSLKRGNNKIFARGVPKFWFLEYGRLSVKIKKIVKIKIFLRELIIKVLHHFFDTRGLRVPWRVSREKSNFLGLLLQVFYCCWRLAASFRYFEGNFLAKETKIYCLKKVSKSE